MIQVAVLTEEQKDLLVGQEFTTDSYFMPIEDNNGNYILSLEVLDKCTSFDYLWVKELPLIDYVPKTVENV